MLFFESEEGGSPSLRGVEAVELLGLDSSSGSSSSSSSSHRFSFFMISSTISRPSASSPHTSSTGSMGLIVDARAAI